MTSSTRMRWLILIALSVVLLRWWDPIGVGGNAADVAEAVVRPNLPSVTHQTKTLAGPSLVWPLRPADAGDQSGNAFASRLETQTPPIAPPRIVAVPQPVFTQPAAMAPEPPIEHAPDLKVVGTWGSGDKMSVFLDTPQGLVQVELGAVLMGSYQVKSIDQRTLVLVNTKTTKNWSLTIPDAPTQLANWPGR